MPANFATYDDILKIDYLPGIVETLNNRVFLFNRIQRTSEGIVGKNAYIPMHIGRNEGVGSRAEGEDLPRAGQQQHDSVSFTMANFYGRIEITGPVMAASKNDEGAFTQVLDSEVKGLVRDAGNDLNRISFGNGTGVLTACGVTAASNTVVVSSVKFIRVGMMVDIRVTATGAVGTGGTGRTVTSVNKTAATFVIDGAPITTDATYSVYRENSRNKEMYGLAAIVSETNVGGGVTNYGNIDRSVDANDWWRGQQLDNSAVARPLSLDLMQEAEDESDLQGAGSITLIITDFVQYRNYANLLLPDRRYNTAGDLMTTLDGGYKTLTFNDKPIVKDKDAPATKMWFLDEETFRLFEMSEFDWMDKDGSILARVSNKDAYEAVLFKYCNLGNEDPKNNVVIEDLSPTL